MALSWRLVLGVELYRIDDVLKPAEVSTASHQKGRRLTGRKPSGEIFPRAEPLVSFEFGGHFPIGTNPSLRLKAYLPGNLLAELKLNIKSKQVSKLRKVVKALLSAN